MGESNRNSALPPEREQPAKSAKPSNKLQDEVVQQWHVDSVMKKADANHDQKLTKDELKSAIKQTEDAPPGMANFSKDEHRIAKQIRDEYDTIKDLVHDRAHDIKLVKDVIKDKDISKADLKKYVESKADNSQLAKYFDSTLQKMAMTPEMKNEHSNTLNTDRLNFTREALRAMANGDPAELGKILSTYSWMAPDNLKKYTDKINDIVKEYGGSIAFSDKGGKTFDNVVFPHITGKSINPVSNATPSSDGMTVYPSKTERISYKPRRTL